MHNTILALLVAFAVGGCGKTAGIEKGPCYGNGTCNDGLECLSETCVVPKHAPGALGAVQKLVADVCACKDEQCAEALVDSTTAMEELYRVDPENGKLQEKKLSACVTQLAPRGMTLAQESQRKAKASEVSQHLKKMSDAARTYYASPGIDQNGSMLAKQFPKSVGPTPPKGLCCGQGGQCRPNAKDWDHPVWKALDFSISTPHYYSYELVTAKVDGEASFTAIAHGDLDCDGEYSLFSRFGMVVDGEVQTAADIIKSDPLE